MSEQWVLDELEERFHDFLFFYWYFLARHKYSELNAIFDLYCLAIFATALPVCELSSRNDPFNSSCTFFHCHLTSRFYFSQCTDELSFGPSQILAGSDARRGAWCIKCEFYSPQIFVLQSTFTHTHVVGLESAHVLWTIYRTKSNFLFFMETKNFINSRGGKIFLNIENAWRRLECTRE